jgi:hypothetical protein
MLGGVTRAHGPAAATVVWVLSCVGLTAVSANHVAILVPG